MGILLCNFYAKFTMNIVCISFARTCRIGRRSVLAKLLGKVFSAQEQEQVRRTLFQEPPFLQQMHLPLLDADASAGAGVTGARAGAGARVARAEAGMKNTPLQAHVELVGANAEAGVSLGYVGASAGAHLGEAKAGPFAVRAGFKVGAGIRNGVPEVDIGPVSCSVM